jgi:hypothetical protein
VAPKSALKISPKFGPPFNPKTEHQQLLLWDGLCSPISNNMEQGWVWLPTQAKRRLPPVPRDFSMHVVDARSFFKFGFQLILLIESCRACVVVKTG